MKIIELSNGIVIERAKLAKLTVDDLAKTMNEIAQKGKEIIPVESFSEFFSKNSLVKAFDNIDTKNIALITEYLGIIITSEELAQAEKFRDLRKSIIERIPTGTYTFAEVPGDWDFYKTFTINETYIRRSSYRMTIKTAKNLWGTAFLVWNGTNQPPEKLRLSADGYKPTVKINMDSIEIGCQKIPRYQVEQLALKMGWIENNE